MIGVRVVKRDERTEGWEGNLQDVFIIINPDPKAAMTYNYTSALFPPCPCPLSLSLIPQTPNNDNIPETPQSPQKKYPP
jgi:hypothetical protein